MRHHRIPTAALATILATAAFGCAPADEPDDTPVIGEQSPLQIGKKYLALGDSVAFGFNPEDAANDPTDLSHFVGYPEIISRAFIPTTNASCEGETSGSFMSPLAPDNGCREWKAAGNAMHVAYDGTQLQFAMDWLADPTNRRTATVSVGIGANDLLILQKTCTATAPTPEAIGACIYASGGTKTVQQCATELVTACIAANAPATIQNAANNLATILGAIRSTGYAGQIVVVTYYTTQYADPSDMNLIAMAGLDQALVQVAQYFDVHVAKGFSAFARASAPFGYDACAAGLLYELADGGCDIHPSRAGQALLAAVVAAAVPARSIDLSAATPQF